MNLLSLPLGPGDLPPGGDIRAPDYYPYRRGDSLPQHQSRLYWHHRVAIYAGLGRGNRGYYPAQVAPVEDVAKLGLGGDPPDRRPASFLVLAAQTRSRHVASVRTAT